MIRITKQVFADLAIWMLVFGLLVGLFFPFFLSWQNFNADKVLIPSFFATTLLAGIFLAGVNFLLASYVVRPKLKHMAKRMLHTEQMIHLSAKDQSFDKCDPEKCMIQVDSSDEIGEAASAFNAVVNALAETRKQEHGNNEFAKILTSELKLQDLNQQALELILQHTETAAGAIFLRNDSEISLVANHAIDDTDSLCHSSQLANAFDLKSIEVIDIPQNVVIESLLTRFRPRQVLMAPIQFEDTVHAVVLLADNKTFSSQSKSFMNLARLSFGLALNNALVHSQLEHIAAIDTLTKIYNRRFGLERVRQEVSRSIRHKTPLGICLFDIDHFKTFNDTYGHLVGDLVLSTLAETINNMLRDCDVFLRYGGEEFVIALPGANIEMTRLVTERARKVIEALEIQHQEKTLKLTISLGYTARPDDENTDEMKLINHADLALYYAKEHGRNCTVNYFSLNQ
ncbi:MAG: diguanylate cyclase [bacterium]